MNLVEIYNIPYIWKQWKKLNLFQFLFTLLFHSGNTCSEDGPCYGGAARRATVIKDIRSNHQNVLLLDAGDQSQGKVTSRFLSKKI